MKFNKVRSIIALTAMPAWLLAQNAEDAIRYSYTQMGGTALSMGMGGATGAVGGDFTSAAINPAGLGLYRQSEWGISVGLALAGSNSTYLGAQNDNQKANFNIPNLHLVVFTPNANRLKTKGWLGTTFSVGYTKLNNFAEAWKFRGDNAGNSIVNSFIERSGNQNPEALDPFSTYLAYQTYLIDPDDSLGGYTSNNGPLNGGINQLGICDRRGRAGETSISFAGNYSNRLYVGGAFLIRRVVFLQDYSYTEEDRADTLSTFDNMNYSINQEDRATSVGFRLGAIYRVNDYFRLGASALLPLEYRVRTESTYEMTSALINGNNNYAVDHEYSYRLRQSPRFTASGVFTYRKLGLISVDYEWVAYNRLRMVDDADSFEAANNDIREGLRNTGNLRIGAELRFNELYVRTGVQMLSTPFESDYFGKTRWNYSLGFGYRVREMYFDAAYVFATAKGPFQPYGLQNGSQPVAQITSRLNQLVLSVGTRF
jgi:hypothetical protein